MKVRALLAAAALAVAAIPALAAAAPVPTLTASSARSQSQVLLQKIAVKEAEAGFGVTGSYLSGCYRQSRTAFSCSAVINFADGTHCVNIVKVWHAANWSNAARFWIRSSSKATYCGY